MRVDREQLVERTVEQRAAERRLIGVGTVGVVDARHHVALARQVLAEVREQEAVAGIAVREDHQREGSSGGRRRGVTPGAAVQRGGGAGVAREHPVVGLRSRGARRTLRGVPQLDRQRPVVARRRLARLRAQHVDLVGVDQRQRAHADGVLAEGGELGRVGADDVDAVGGDGGGGDEQRGEHDKDVGAEHDVPRRRRVAKVARRGRRRVGAHPAETASVDAAPEPTTRPSSPYASACVAVWGRGHPAGGRLLACLGTRSPPTSGRRWRYREMPSSPRVTCRSVSPDASAAGA
jgi:hypothetical protein